MVNLIVTELAVIEVTPRGLVLKEIASDTTVEKVRAATGAELIVDDTPLVFEPDDSARRHQERRLRSVVLR